MGAPEIVFPNLGVEISRLPREAFSIGTLSIYWYSIFVTLGVAIGLLVAVKEAKRVGHNVESYYNFLFYAIIASLIGLRLFYVAFNWESYRGNLMRIFAIREGGLAIIRRDYCFLYNSDCLYPYKKFGFLVIY